MNHPPRPRLTLNLGITGHRTTSLPAGIVPQLRPVIEEVFERIALACHRLRENEGIALFSPEKDQLRLHTPLATGADQIAADTARKFGYRVRALLPFAPEIYRGDFAPGVEQDEFDRQMEAADSMFALPCGREDPEEGYVMVGKAVVAASDILVAIWDGEKARGAGGTAHVVQLAEHSGVPVIHVALSREPAAVRGVTLRGEKEQFALVTQEDYDLLVARVLAPLPDVARDELAQFYAEEEIRRNNRIEYPLMLSLLGVRKMSASDRYQRPIAQDVADEFDNSTVPADETLRQAYGWTNFLGIRYAQMFRSGHVLNYVLSALAVLLALIGLVGPSLKVWLVMSELAVIGSLILNTRAGNRAQWHRRWLQYRHLAETLRPLAVLKQTGLAPPPFRGKGHFKHNRHRSDSEWTRWYAAAIWRQMPNPVGIVTAERVRELVAAVVEEQLRPQAGYHRSVAHRMHKLDHRLHRIGGALMGTVVVVCVIFLLAYAVSPEWASANAGAFVFMTAGLPAIGAAVFGLRGHGEHLIAANRSSRTVDALDTSIEEIESLTDIEELSREIENAAEIMLSDLNEWTLAYHQRSLEIPA